MKQFKFNLFCDLFSKFMSLPSYILQKLFDWKWRENEKAFELPSQIDVCVCEGVFVCVNVSFCVSICEREKRMKMYVYTVKLKPLLLLC